jgi:hypothetical protein
MLMWSSRRYVKPRIKPRPNPKLCKPNQRNSKRVVKQHKNSSVYVYFGIIHVEFSSCMIILEQKLDSCIVQSSFPLEYS